MPGFSQSDLISQLLGDGGSDSTQPDFGAAFGLQPLATRGRDINPDGTRRKVGLIGAGDVYDLFLMRSWMQRGTELFVIDPNKDVVAQSAEKGVTVHRLASLEQMPRDVDYVTILTPPDLHAACFRQVVEAGFAVAMEKPIARNQGDLDDIRAIARQAKKPLYTMDWEVLHALPLLHAAGADAPFPDAVSVSDPLALRGFDFSELRGIRVCNLQSNDDMEGLKALRPWLFDHAKGGGMLRDWGVHPMNALAAMGLQTTAIDSVELGALTAQNGLYRRLGREDGKATADFYARFNLQMVGSTTALPVPALFEVGMHAAKRENYIELIDARSNTLRLELFPVAADGERIMGSRMEMRNPGGRVVATSSMQADCYSLMVEDMSRHARTGHGARNLEQHAAVIETIEQMDALARSVPQQGIITPLSSVIVEGLGQRPYKPDQAAAFVK